MDTNNAKEKVVSRISELGIKTSVTRREGDELARLAAGKLVVEVGSLLGYTTIKMAKTARLVTAIDPHRDYPSCRPSPTLYEFLGNLLRHNVNHKVVSIPYRAQEVLHFCKPRDFGFIDATGLYADTMFCLENLRCDVIACHDYGRRSCDGATKAVDEFVRNHNKQCRVIDTLAVIT